MKSISYAITVCNEFVELQALLPHILKYKRREDEVVILFDESKGDEGVEEFLRAKSVNNAFAWHKDKFDTILQECDEIIFLYRRDFEAQAKGWIAWNMAGDHDHHYGDLRTYNIDVSQEVANKYIKELKDNYRFMNYAFKRYGGNVYCMEDFPHQIPYSRRYNWINDIQIPNYKTHKEVFRS